MVVPPTMARVELPRRLFPVQSNPFSSERDMNRITKILAALAIAIVAVIAINSSTAAQKVPSEVPRNYAVIVVSDPVATAKSAGLDAASLTLATEDIAATKSVGVDTVGLGLSTTTLTLMPLRCRSQLRLPQSARRRNSKRLRSHWPQQRLARRKRPTSDRCHWPSPDNSHRSSSPSICRQPRSH